MPMFSLSDWKLKRSSSPVKKSKGKKKVVEEPFDFASLPTEMKYEVFKYIKISFLEEVCSEVSIEWRGMISDIVNLRLKTVDKIIRPDIQNELKTYLHRDGTPVDVLKLFERSALNKGFALTPIQVNDDALNRADKGIIRKIWRTRACDCRTIDHCIAQIVHVMNGMNLLVVQAARELRFFHLEDFERLESGATKFVRGNYRCINYNTKADLTWFESDSTVGISVFQNQIITQENPRTLLLLQVMSCEHESRTVYIQRLRRIHLPLWCHALCLLKDMIYIVYSTGTIGKWSKLDDELAMTNEPVLVGRTDQSNVHSTRMFRLGDLVFIKSRRGGADSSQDIWYVHDSNDPSMTFQQKSLAILVTTGFLQEQPSWECTEVFYIGIWCNFFIAHYQLQSLLNGEIKHFLSVKRIQKMPEIKDVLCNTRFGNNFLVNTFMERGKTIVLNGSLIAPFLPISLDLRQLNPPNDDPVPVIDMVAVHWAQVQSEQRNRKRMKTFRIRISNRYTKK